MLGRWVSDVVVVMIACALALAAWVRIALHAREVLDTLVEAQPRPVFNRSVEFTIVQMPYAATDGGSKWRRDEPRVAFNRRYAEFHGYDHVTCAKGQFIKSLDHGHLEKPYCMRWAVDDAMARWGSGRRWFLFLDSDAVINPRYAQRDLRWLVEGLGDDIAAVLPGNYILDGCTGVMLVSGSAAGRRSLDMWIAEVKDNLYGLWDQNAWYTVMTRMWSEQPEGKVQGSLCCREHALAKGDHLYVGETRLQQDALFAQVLQLVGVPHTPSPPVLSVHRPFAIHAFFAPLYGEKRTSGDAAFIWHPAGGGRLTQRDQAVVLHAYDGMSWMLRALPRDVLAKHWDHFLGGMAGAPQWRFAPNRHLVPRSALAESPLYSPSGLRDACTFFCGGGSCGLKGLGRQPGQCVAVDMCDARRGGSSVQNLRRVQGALAWAAFPVLLVTLHQRQCSADAASVTDALLAQVAASDAVQRWVTNDCTAVPTTTGGAVPPHKVSCFPAGAPSSDARLRALGVELLHGAGQALARSERAHTMTPSCWAAAAPPGRLPAELAARWREYCAQPAWARPEQWKEAVSASTWMLTTAVDREETWLALLAGACVATVAETRAQLEAYRDLPVTFIRDWADLNATRLAALTLQCRQRGPWVDRLLLPHWRARLWRLLHTIGSVQGVGSAPRPAATALAPDVAAGLPRQRRQGTILWCHLGQDLAHGEHVRRSVVQARRWNPKARLVLIAPAKALASDVVKRLASTAALELVRAESISSPLINEFNRHFFVSGDMGITNRDFNRVTSARLYYVHAWMEREGAEHVFHLENDNMLYVDVLDLLPAAAACNLQLGAQVREMSNAARFMVLGTVYIRSAAALGKALSWSLALMRQGAELAVQRLRTQWVNDMSMFGTFFWENMERAGAGGSGDGPLSVLPDGGEVLGTVQACVSRAWRMIFDNAAISIWNHGSFQWPVAYTDSVAWGAYSRIDAPRGQLRWEVDDQGRRFPLFNELRVASLHVHSKRLADVMSMQGDVALSE